jgi:hypothetical protein
MKSAQNYQLQWSQNPSETNGDNLNNVRRETSRTLGKKEGILKEKINELETNSKNKNI